MVCSVPALPGCHAWGESYEHLLEMLEDAVQDWLEVASDREELEPEKQLIELTLRKPFPAKCFAKL
ncbi:type II toxin-antitoxin system HicB family antitoxin [Leptolyngbya sp. AN03gr2]|uniref:type II toxin-antitoxin system HicB family antitoxin n=1 Tax=unclassified Leptolyngbya TaxID=2650499 RepID=UPI003D31507B